VRKLVESDEVFAIYQVIGTPGNTAIQKYLNQKGVPQTFIGSGATKWADPKNFPWSMAWQPNYQSEARIYARYIKQNYPGKTVGILYQNDDFGKDYLTGFHEAFGADTSKIIVAEVPYEVTAPTVDQGRQPGHLRQHHDAEVRGAGDQEARRDEMDAGAHPHQRVGLDRLGHEAGRLRELAGHHQRGLSEGPERPAMEERQGHERVARVHDQVVSRR
jgi:hypothetical protein